MSAPRLTFLYPSLFAPARPTFAQQTLRLARRELKTSSRKRQSVVNQRYGTANEPPPHLIGGKTMQPPTLNPKDAALSQAKDTDKDKAQAKLDAKSKTGNKASKADQTLELQQHEAIDDHKVSDKHTADVKTASVATETPSKHATPGKMPPAASLLAGEMTKTVMDAAESQPSTPPPKQPSIPTPNAMETVLTMPSPDGEAKARAPVSTAQTAATEKERNLSVTTSEDHKPPRISTPPYVHHFDTYGLVKRLEEGGFTEKHAVTIMKAVRLTLADNMDLAREGLVSKSNVENETYLFRAACSELRTEIQTRRQSAVEKSRTERTQLQHEVDILGQRLTQEGGMLKDDLKGMFDDRKMGVRNEQRRMEGKIQELNYGITVKLNSDSRSDVEGVRWIITKRAIAALAICVTMVFGSLKYTSTMMLHQEEERKRFASMTGHEPSHGEGHGRKQQQHGGHEVGEMLVQASEGNPSFISLG